MRVTTHRAHPGTAVSPPPEQATVDPKLWHSGRKQEVHGALVSTGTFSQDKLGRTPPRSRLTSASARCGVSYALPVRLAHPALLIAVDAVPRAAYQPQQASGPSPRAGLTFFLGVPGNILSIIIILGCNSKMIGIQVLGGLKKKVRSPSGVSRGSGSSDCTEGPRDCTGRAGTWGFGAGSWEKRARSCVG